MSLPLIALLMLSATAASLASETQITSAPQNHMLTNVNVWSPDGQWIVYDTRTGHDFDGTRIERVNTATGETQLLYQSKNGAGCGVVTYNPKRPEVALIHGPEHPSPDWNYSFTRRRGVLVQADGSGKARPLDAMNYAPPFVPGALRGGSHVHVFSPDGEWVSFTYEDEVLARLDADPAAPPHDRNLRVVGVSVPSGPVEVAESHPRNHDGSYFSVVVTEVVAAPEPGSDQISKAFEEGWVGVAGYEKPDGSRQLRALAFQGMVAGPDGRPHPEVFIVDLLNDLTKAGDGPLQGTATTRPAPPKGAAQRRLTFTADRPYPGVAAAPRHWLRASPDGSAIAFLMKDEAGIAQLWTVSPNGGPPRQITLGAAGLESAFTWSPDGRRLAHVMDGSVCVTEVASGQTTRLTERREDPHRPSADACVFSPDGKQVAFVRPVTNPTGTRQQIFAVSVPEA